MGVERTRVTGAMRELLRRLYESSPDCLHFANEGQLVWWMFCRLPSCVRETFVSRAHNP